VKAINQAMLALHIWGLGEGLVALARMGVNPAVALDIINASSGRSNTSQNLFPQRVITRAFPRTFKLALLDKDVGIAARSLREQKVPAPLTQLVAELMSIAHRELGEDADHVEAVKVIERMAGEVIN
jgi:3-hydroxyisobutyrate dehydrogenase